jgi:proteic killer suppression protein
MIISFACRDTEKLFHNKHVNRFSSFLRQAQVKLKLLNAVKNLNDLRSPPGNRLEMLVGDRKHQYSIRINDKWRLCFTWENGNAYNVEIVDYH